MIPSREANAQWYDSWADGAPQTVLVQCTDARDLARVRRRVLSAASIRGHVVRTETMPTPLFDRHVLGVFFLGILYKRSTP